MARPALSRDELILKGTFRADRHAKRGEALACSGECKPPAWLKGPALRRFKQIVESYPTGGLTAVDAEPLAVGVTLEIDVIGQLKRVAKRPGDAKLIRTLGGMLTHLTAFHDRFGLSPRERPRVKVPPPLTSGVDNSRSRSAFGRDRAAADGIGTASYYRPTEDMV